MKKGLLFLLVACGLLACSKNAEMDQESPGTKATVSIEPGVDSLRFLSGEQQTLTFNLTTSPGVSWTISPFESDDWEFVSVSPSSGFESGVVSVTVPENTGSTRRTKRLDIEGRSGRNTVYADLYVVQEPVGTKVDTVWTFNVIDSVNNHDLAHIAYYKASYRFFVTCPQYRCIDASGKVISTGYATAADGNFSIYAKTGPEPPQGLTLPSNLPYTGGRLRLDFAENTGVYPIMSRFCVTYKDCSVWTDVTQMAYGNLAPSNWRMDMRYMGSSVEDIEHIPGNSGDYKIAMTGPYYYNTDRETVYPSSNERTVKLRICEDTLGVPGVEYDVTYGQITPTVMSPASVASLYLTRNNWGRTRSGHILAEWNGITFRGHFSQMRYDQGGGEYPNNFSVAGYSTLGSDCRVYITANQWNPIQIVCPPGTTWSSSVGSGLELSSTNSWPLGNIVSSGSSGTYYVRYQGSTSGAPAYLGGTFTCQAKQLQILFYINK